MSSVLEYASATVDEVAKQLGGTGQAVLNVGVAIASAADVITGGIVGTILNMIKNSGDIVIILNKSPSEITFDDAATMAAQIPVLADIVKGFSKAK